MSIKVKDMRITKKEEEPRPESAIVSPQPAYPYGLALHLDDEVLSKLGMDKLPTPGSEGVIAGKVLVESASISKDKDRTRKNLTLQITKLGYKDSTEDIEEESERVDKTGDGPPEASAEKVLFGD